MNENLLRQLESFGQSSWMDISRRGIVLSGELKQLIDDNGRSGVTSNLAVFEKAISDDHVEDADMRSMAFEESAQAS